MYSYLLFLLILAPFLALSAWATAKVNSAFSQYDSVPNRACMTGYDTATLLLRTRGVNDITVNRICGKLTDHYSPSQGQVNLSESTFGSASVAAVGVAAHEVGHVMQKKVGYIPYKIRTLLVPVTNIGSRLAVPVIIIGILLDIFLWSAEGTPYGQYLMYVGIGLYGLSTLFALVTLPVEFNASRRAMKMLVNDGVLMKDELYGVKKVLSAAAMTYVASMLISLVYFLRFAVMILALFRRRD